MSSRSGGNTASACPQEVRPLPGSQTRQHQVGERSWWRSRPGAGCPEPQTQGSSNQARTQLCRHTIASTIQSSQAPYHPKRSRRPLLALLTVDIYHLPPTHPSIHLTLCQIHNISFSKLLDSAVEVLLKIGESLKLGHL